MPKVATRYYDLDPWKIIENGFSEERSLVSESIFSLANEYMGSRGNFEESYSGKTLIGNYFNGIYEIPEKIEQGGYKGISKKNHYMVNSVNYTSTKIYINNVLIDLHKVKYTDFKRVLDLKTGLLERSYIYIQDEIRVKIIFKKILGFKNYHNAYQILEIIPLTENINVKIINGFDYSIVHWGHIPYWQISSHNESLNGGWIIGITKQTKQRVLTKYEYISNYNGSVVMEEKFIGRTYELTLKCHEKFHLEKRIYHDKCSDKDVMDSTLVEEVNKKMITFEETLKENYAYLSDVWKKCDIEIEGDLVNQQGIRYSIFELISTYQGLNLNNNIGAKGLTGEAYSGHAFWDTETYCLPFYLFNNQSAAKDLLLFRYKTLEQAKKRALELDCEGACFPIATLNGEEACNLWQHASLQFQPTSGVAYGIYHYVNVTKDFDFLKEYGLEMLIEISRFFASRGAWNQDHTNYGYYGVMGPDEFQMMVNHNTYTNYMAKKSLDYTIEVLDLVEKKDKVKYNLIKEKTKLVQSEVKNWKLLSSKMKIIYDKKTHLFEQHAGYYDLPHIDIHKIPTTDFPLYANWSYDRIYRNDMIKQPDVLMMMLLYNQSFTKEEKLANYEFYEPRTIHESSLSPSVHSVLALELGKEQEGLDFFGFATRMDLDDYNRNTCEGLHLTSISAAWLNIVYGFGGLRSDGDILVLSPVLPTSWQSYSFKITYQNSLVKVKVEKYKLIIKSDQLIKLKVYDKVVSIDGEYICGR